MTIQKWNEQTKEYEPYDVPNDWKLPLVCDNMDAPINCVNCGEQITFGEGITSKRYHNRFGFGFYECEKCYYDYLPIYIQSKGD